MAHGQPLRHASEVRLTMVCYARPASRMAVAVLVVLLVFGRPVGRFFDAAALMVAITVAAGGAAVAAAVAFAVFLSIRRRRAAAGGCVSCQLRCQHAMTEQPHRLLVVRAAEREATGPRWPDRPAYRSAPASRPARDPRPAGAPPPAWAPRPAGAPPPARDPRPAGAARPARDPRPAGQAERRERAGSAVLRPDRSGNVTVASGSAREERRWAGHPAARSAMQYVQPCGGNHQDLRAA